MTYQPRQVCNTDKMNEVLMAVINDHSSKASKMGPLTEEDIPRSREEWMKSCEDIMKGAPEKLPPLREVNHRIPLIDENKRYKYHTPRCPDSLKPELVEKIAHYMSAGWWEPAQTEQAALMLCMHKKNMQLRIVFESPVAWTEKKPATVPDPTAVRSVSQLLHQQLWTGPVASCIVF
jgi:hypothetical protein